MLVLSEKVDIEWIIIILTKKIFEKKSIGVWLTKWMIPVTDLPEIQSCMRLASTYVVVMTSFPKGSGMSSGSSSLTSPYTDLAQSYSGSGTSDQSGLSTLTRILACLILERYP